MVYKRMRKAVSYSIDPELLDKLEEWLQDQDPQPSKTSVIESAIRQFLKERGRDFDART